MKKPLVFEGIVILLIVLLSFVLYMMIVAGSAGVYDTWELGGNGTVRYMDIDGPDMLYAFSGNNISAIDSTGRLKWAYSFPDRYNICGMKFMPRYVNRGMGWSGDEIPVYDADDNALYVYAMSGRVTSTMEIATHCDLRDEEVEMAREIYAISHNGQLLWNITLSGHLTAFNVIDIKARGDRIYVFHDYNLTVLSKDGKILTDIENVSDPAAIGDDGTIYVSSASLPDGPRAPSWAIPGDYRVPSGIIKAYSPDGILIWQSYAGENISSPYVRPYLKDRYYSLPIINDGLLYVPLDDGIAAMSGNGTELWRASTGEGDIFLYDQMPFDSAGNAYLYRYINTHPDAPKHYIVDMNGTVSGPISVNKSIYFKRGDDGTVYSLEYVRPGENMTIDMLYTVNINAFRLSENMSIWNITLPIKKTTTVTVDKENVYDIFDRWFADRIVQYNGDGRDYNPPYTFLDLVNTTVKGCMVPHTEIYPGKDLIYVSMYSYTYEEPVKLNLTKCVYSSGIYAVSRNGELVWYKPIDTFIDSVHAKNDTIYYSTRDGKISSARVEIAAGITLAAALYVVFRFFLAGVITRGRGSLDRNENRNRVLTYIAENPGMTLYEICRGLSMNMGTARYHIMILGLNHRIVAHQSDNKYVRYFLNSNAYSSEEQYIVSVMRRDCMKGVLDLLLRKPGISNRQISRELGVSESAVSRCMKELHSKGIVVKDLSVCGRASYVIDDRNKEQIIRAMGFTDGR